MKKTIVKPDGTKIVIQSEDKDLVKKVAKGLKEEIEKANRIEKIERIEKIDM